jgi:hypothetical protein
MTARALLLEDPLVAVDRQHRDIFRLPDRRIRAASVGDAAARLFMSQRDSTPRVRGAAALSFSSRRLPVVVQRDRGAGALMTLAGISVRGSRLKPASVSHPNSTAFVCDQPLHLRQHARGNVLQGPSPRQPRHVETLTRRGFDAESAGGQ